MPGLAAAELDAVSLVRRVARALNRRISDLVALLFRHKSAGSFGAVAGFAIAVVFAWKFLRSSSPARPRRPAAPKRPLPGSAAPATDATEPVGDSGKLSTRQIVARRLSGCRRVGSLPRIHYIYFHFWVVWTLDMYGPCIGTTGIVDE